MYSDLKERIVPLIRELDNTQFGAGKKILDIIDEYEEKFKGCICWSKEDFLDRALEAHGYDLYTEDEAQEDLEEMIEKHDCNYGITWDTLDDYIIQRIPKD